MLSGTGLFVFSDPGGAKLVLGMIKESKTLRSFTAISDRVYEFFDDFEIQVTRYNQGDEQHYVASGKFDFLFTATSYTSKIELKFLSLANKIGMQSYSYIDHYTRFKDRFLDNGNYIYPHHLLVLDEKAKQVALHEGLPAEKIKVHENPYFKFLREWKPRVSREAFFETNNITKDWKLIVFAPDPVTNVGGMAAYGFEECTVFDNLVAALVDNKSNHNFVLALKLHPNQNRALFESRLKGTPGINIIDFSDLHTLTVLYHADIIIGMFSNILKEAEILGKKVIRCLIGLHATDPFAGQEVGKVVHQQHELQDQLTLELANIP